ncbi:p-hydroxybenzoic acid efflux pump subunit AaeA [Vibrio aerogenes CECT 7868]|uniref:p-hydroxybenzoic acid efflux pump subunit AaeA n=1 Tax=Vibrio aerogenes CECT 7868 TaxID=1216006 RepID=A0A1M5ZSV8_9VIBR|nr:efflux RND transporter periplasmic adaptor subunit [Vibrio aerogenes]SHI27186.1 p-hydroxybenzoic acid efflux pump subunit AaeA [Vibrio aerogenes CECT 7868]
MFAGDRVLPAGITVPGMLTLLSMSAVLRMAAVLGIAALGIAAPALAQTTVSHEPEVIRVQLRPKADLIVSGEIAGRLAQLPFKAGDAFHQGDVLAGVNCEIYQARLGHAKAGEKLSEQKFQVAKKLNRLESISVMEVGQAEADLDMARSERRVAQLMVKRCRMTAPFDGRVSQRFVQPGEFVTEGKKLLEIYNTSAYEVEFIVPSRWVSLIQTGQTFQVTLDETGDTYPATIIRLGSVIDSLSQSYTVYGEIQSRPGLVLMPGMSGNAHLHVSEQTAESK